MEFGERLKTELKAQKISLVELSAKTKISNRTLSSYINAEQKMAPANNATKIAEVLGVSVEYLVTGTERHSNIIEKQFYKKYSKFENILEQLDQIPSDSFEDVEVLFNHVGKDLATIISNKNKTKKKLQNIEDSQQ